MHNLTFDSILHKSPKVYVNCANFECGCDSVTQYKSGLIFCGVFSFLFGFFYQIVTKITSTYDKLMKFQFGDATDDDLKCMLL